MVQSVNVREVRAALKVALVLIGQELIHTKATQ